MARADDLMLLAAEGIDVHRPLAVAPRPPVGGSPPVTVGREAELSAFPPQAARLQVNRARALLRLAQCRGGRAGPAAAARLLTEAGATADRLGMRALAGEASELLSEC